MKEENEKSSFAKASEDKGKKPSSDLSAEAQGAKAEATASQEELKKKLEECEKKATEYLAGWQRARADLLNYKKEEMERIGDILKYANVDLILKILPILDNFEIVEKKLSEDLKKDENVKGLLLIKNQILDFLKSQGVEEIKSVGEKFDPNLHEVVEETKVENGESGVVIEEIQKGYKINGRLLRPAKVRIVK